MLRKSLIVGITCAIGLSGAVSAQDSDDVSTLYSVDFETGELTSLAEIDGEDTIVGFALVPVAVEATPVAEVATPVVDGATEVLAAALTDDNAMFIFDVNDPSTAGAPIDITGLEDDEELVGIDFRPANGELWTISDQSRLYSIDLESGEATSIGGEFDPTIEDDDLGFDFNPTVDRIRVDVSTGQNLRLNPETGLIGSNPDTGEPTIDGTLEYLEGDVNEGTDPQVVGAAYTNSVADAEETMLFVIDAETDSLALQNPPNDGVLNTVGPLGVEISEDASFDIAPTGEGYVVNPN